MRAYFCQYLTSLVFETFTSSQHRAYITAFINHLLQLLSFPVFFLVLFSPKIIKTFNIYLKAHKKTPFMKKLINCQFLLRRPLETLTHSLNLVQLQKLKFLPTSTKFCPSCIKNTKWRLEGKNRILCFIYRNI